MQRDIDLMRQLLLEIEVRGASSPIDALRCGTRRDGEERTRYHVRLLVDAGLLKEAGQNSDGVPCVRLTHEGHEFIELARSDIRWSAVKSAVQSATGGVPLAIVKSLLANRAWRLVIRNERRGSMSARERIQRYVEGIEPSGWLETPAVEPDGLWDDDQSRFAQSRAVIGPDRVPPAWDTDLYGDLAAELAELPAAAQLPQNLV